ncbi:AhpC-TSA-domain-containing protein [Rickenella mellea]|uniref:thioredoxin-dependent peroxiredoxin n=1 Tax=Rickenella mellea TaxID=50990 RepID=A0A4Y7PWS0_9AGAM|nr:AhpC-TSA-domain-containing protein [Rickenella mellea]
MARKAATDPDAPAVEPRRSARAAALPKKETAPAPAKEKKPRASKKRTAEEATAEGEETAEGTGNPADENGESSKKKAKGDSADDEEKDELESDGAEDVKSLAIGDSLPALTLKNEKDEDVNVQNLADNNGVVLFLIPKADTPGCTTQACGFRDSYPDFEGVNYKVYCLSADTIAAQSKWQAKFTLPYPLLSDRQRVLIKALGAADGKKTKRSHFIFEKGGKLIEKKVPVKPADSPKLALEFIKGLSAST